jgi:NhaP-type Na+/H+ or K+/H+ antiporter
MNKKIFVIFISIAINLGLCGMLYLFLYLSRGDDYKRNLSDATFIISIFNIAFAGLKFVSSQGFFDGLSYSIKNIFTFKYDRESFFDYKTKKNERREKGFKQYINFLINFVLFLLISISIDLFIK